jgi:NADPH2:quinone reductase
LADKLILLPEGISFEQAAAMPLQGMTAHYLLHDFRKINRGDVVLIHAAAGGMGLLLVQWAKHLGARVIGTVSNDTKAQAAKAAGADEVIIYTKLNFVNEVLRLTNNHGADLIIDGVGKATFERDFEAAAIRATIVLYGSAGGTPDPIDPRLLMPKSLTLSSGSLPNFTRTHEELTLRANAVIAAIKEGWLQLRINRILPLNQAKEAHRLLEGRETIGKVLLSTQ